MARTQTTTLTQELAPGATKSPRQVTGCINAYLSDGETFSFNDTLQYYGSYSILGNLSFRGVEYQMTGNSSGYQVIDLHNAQGFAIHEAFSVRCYRGCIQTWLNGYLVAPNVFVGVQVDSSSDPAFTVPGSLTIPAGQVAASGAINAAVIAYNQPAVAATITATYPDGRTATIVVTDDPGPAPPTVDDSRLMKPFSPCGSKHSDCLSLGPVTNSMEMNGAFSDSFTS